MASKSYRRKGSSGKTRLLPVTSETWGRDGGKNLRRQSSPMHIAIEPSNIYVVGDKDYRVDYCKQWNLQAAVVRGLEKHTVYFTVL